MIQKTILVTGGAGFLGSNLCERLLAMGNKVICLDNFQTGRRQNLTHLEGNDDFDVIEHDIINPIELKVDGIYNLACAASPPHYQADPIHTTKTCVFGVINMLELAKKNNAPIMHASTSEVYGDPEVHPQTESYHGNVNPDGPRACYDEGKRCSESLCFDYQRVHGVDIKIARIFNTYGPQMDPNDGRVVSNFIVQAISGKSLTIYGDGSQTRSFCYVDDMITGFVKLMASGDFHGPVNLGNPNEFTVKELAEKTLAMTGSQSKIEYLPLPDDDPRMRCPDITLAKTRLDWSPGIPLEQGLIKTIEYFSAQIK
jgi:UDP-glucuronate decarboxylase